MVRACLTLRFPATCAAVGRDLDDITQAVECSTGRPIIGVQWRPEYLFYVPSQFAIFRWLIRRTV